ncbi:hypothetical protein HPP92_005094 [Vanilla planifolia]|uniref:Uncharacterized protein n=1 Tax=Vanilla planifolia TaxID=51239 RepID=A0A835RTE2_VANPL|nr:hypothetical protein HPP92_005094 [Vanilla planifolia]
MPGICGLSFFILSLCEKIEKEMAFVEGNMPTKKVFDGFVFQDTFWVVEQSGEAGGRLWRRRQTSGEYLR